MTAASGSISASHRDMPPPFLLARPLARPLALLSLSLASCGAGSAGVITSTSGSGSSSANGPVQVSAFEVSETSGGAEQDQPAHIHLVLSDSESDPANVRLYYILPGAAAPGTPIVPVGASGPSISLATAPNGVVHELLWNFTQEPDFDGSLRQGVTLWVKAGRATSPGTANSRVVDLGNDRPRVLSVTGPAAGEASANVDVQLELSDTQGDRLDVLVEYEVLGDGQGYRLARPAGTPLSAPTPEFAFQNLLVGAAGLELVFVWDSLFDLPGREVDVALRVSALDAVLAGEPLVSDALRIDNNTAPLAFLNNDQLLFNPDRRRALPVAVELLDEEGDPVEFLLQWRRTNESFPALPEAVEELRSLLEDPVARHALQVCSEAPTSVGGLVGGPAAGLDPARFVRLPELGARAAQALAGGIEGRELLLTRPRRAYESLRAATLQSLVDVVLEAGGESAVVLRASGAVARLTRVSLSSGANLGELAALNGTPLALARSPDGAALFVALLEHDGGPGAVDWSVARVDATSGVTLGTAGRRSDQSAPRALAAAGPRRAFASVNDELVELDFHAAPLVKPAMAGLCTPWGLAIDPVAAERLLLVERGQGPADGRVLEVRLDSFAARRLAVRVRAGDEAELGRVALPSPTRLALRAESGQLYVLCESGAARELRSFHPRAPGGAEVSLELRSNAPLTGLALGAEGASVLVAGAGDELLVAGGLRARGRIRAGDGAPAYDPATGLVHLEEPLDPPARAGDPWSIPLPLRAAPLAAGPNRRVFVWDSSDAPTGGEILLRLLAWDTDVSTPTVGQAPKQVLAGLSHEPVLIPLGDSGREDVPLFVTSADLDGDGDLDLIYGGWGSDRIAWIEQLESGQLAAPVDLLPQLGQGPDQPRSLALGDLDGDGDLDLVSANEGGGDLWLIRQTSPGSFSFDARTDRLGTGLAQGAFWVQLGDLDRNGRLDVVASCPGARRVLVYLQDAAGNFERLEDPDLQLDASLRAVAEEPTEIALADVNGDGELDILAAERSVGQVLVFERSAGAELGFEAPLRLAQGAQNRGARGLAVVDLDRDAYPDLLVANRDADSLTLFAGALGGLESDALVLSTASFGRGPVDIGVGDVDRDGDLDFVTANRNNANHTLFLRNSTGAFELDPNGALELPNPGTTRIAELLDFNGDGTLDLLSSSVATELAFLRLQDERGRFHGPPLVLQEPARTINPGAFDVGDFDGDGDLDVVCGNLRTDDLSLFLQVGPGRFELSPLGPLAPPVFDVPRAVRFADLDADGDLDIVCADSGAGGALALFFQAADGSFEHDPVRDRLGGGPAGAPDSSLQISDLALGDLNGDGLLDLATSNQGDDDLTIFFQDALLPGRFPHTPDLRLEPLEPNGQEPALQRPVALALGDLDRDGRTDIACVMDRSAADQGHARIALFFQSAAGFGPDPDQVLGDDASAPVDRPEDVLLSDLDGDGWLDLVTTSRAGSAIHVYHQRSAASFDAPLVVGPLPERPRALGAGDVDGDGDLDLIATGRDFVMFARQVGRAHFRIDAQPISLVAEGSASLTGVHALDMDGDGDLDLLTLSRALDAVLLLFGDHD